MYYIQGKIISIHLKQGQLLREHNQGKVLSDFLLLYSYLRYNHMGQSNIMRSIWGFLFSFEYGHNFLNQSIENTFYKKYILYEA